MADFQTKVNIAPALGLPGQQISTAVAYTSINYVSDGTVAAGSFAFADPADAGKGLAHKAYSKVASNGRLLGFVARVNSGVIGTPFVPASNAYGEGQNITIAIRGQFLLEVPASANPTEGQSVLCEPTTGAITFGDAGTANDTGWIVHLPQGMSTASEGDIVIIENYGVQATKAAGA